jgi:transcriptional regulator GlxA family with amidase domain
LATAINSLADELNGTAEREVLALLAGWVDLEARKIVRGARPPDARLRGLWDKVEGELARRWSVTELARVAGVGPEQLRRLCQVAHGTSPLDHLFRLRMARAAALLSGTPLKAEVIAEAVGYGGVFAFSAAFKRRFGLAPSHYRSEAIRS